MIDLASHSHEGIVEMLVKQTMQELASLVGGFGNVKRLTLCLHAMKELYSKLIPKINSANSNEQRESRLMACVDLAKVVLSIYSQLKPTLGA